MKTLLITGSREYDNIAQIENIFHQLKEEDPLEEWTLIHGGARGADMLADHVARNMKWPQNIIKCLPDWNKHGKKAGIIRNSQMIENYQPHCAIAFHLNNSPGTKHCIGELNKYRGQIDTKMKRPVIIVKE